MKTILCYGDSNTWGHDPREGVRHRYEDRWTTILGDSLGNGYLVIPEGLNGRTTVWDDPVEGNKNGKAQLVPCLESHKPLDLVILFLGTNDLKARFSLTAWDIAAGAGTLVDMIKWSGCGHNWQAPEILVLIPPQVRKLGFFADMFEGSEAKSVKFPDVFSQMAGEKGVRFLDIGKSVRLSDLDGIHFEKDQLKILGQTVAAEVRTILG